MAMGTSPKNQLRHSMQTLPYIWLAGVEFNTAATQYTLHPVCASARKPIIAELNLSFLQLRSVHSYYDSAYKSRYIA